MPIHPIWANLAVQDTKKTAQFYTHLGFKLNTPVTPELASLLFGDNNFVIHFFRQDTLDFAMHDHSGGRSEVLFSLAAQSEREVDDWAIRVQDANGTIIKKAGRHEDGFYYCVFTDPDGHHFNVLYVEAGMV